MKRSILYAFLLALLAVFAGCVKEIPVDPFRGDVPEYPTEGKALVRMSAVFPVAPGTKAMADLPSVSIIRVAVFGSSGFLKEVVDGQEFAYRDGQGGVVETNKNSVIVTFADEIIDVRNINENNNYFYDIKDGVTDLAALIRHSRNATIVVGNQDDYDTLKSIYNKED